MTASVDRAGDRLFLQSAALEIDVDLANGTMSVREGVSGRTLLDSRLVQATLEDGSIHASAGRPWRAVGGPQRFEDVHGPGVRVLLAGEPRDGVRLHIEVCVFDAQPFALLRVGVENGGDAPRRVRSLSLASDLTGFEASPAAWRVYRHGWQSWSPSLSLSGAQRDVGSRPPVLAPEAVPSMRGDFASDEVSAVFDPATGTSFVAGFVTAHRFVTQVRVNAGRRALEAVALTDGVPLAPGESLWSERLLLDAGRDTPAVLDRYAAALGREMGACVPAASPSGWCSWYDYFTTVTEADVLKNLRFLEQHRDSLPLGYVQIDDGYQANIGDWTETNDKFPHGMAWLAGQIKEAGFQPGIWLAPFLAGASSRLHAEHPDWFIRDEHGAPAIAMRNWDQDCYGLDCTHPGAEAWLRDLFREITEGWGYQYVKIDFLFGAAIAGRRHDTATRVEAYRRGLRAVRESVGERFVLGCGALMGPSVGLVDGQRIGPDVAPWWRFNRPVEPPREKGRPSAGGEPSAENSLRNIFTRSWMHGRLWANDPDCLLVRSDRTKLTLPEVQSLATAIAMSGGMVLLSDEVTQLDRQRRDIASLLLPPLGEAPRVPDLMTRPMPSRLELEVQRDFETWRLLACFNWERRRRSLSTKLPPGRWHAFELWERRYYGEVEGEIDLADVPSHGVRLLALRRPRNRPQLVGSTFHASMGGQEVVEEEFDTSEGVLVLRLRSVAKTRGELFVTPNGLRLASSDLDGSPVRALGSQDVLRFRFDLVSKSTLKLCFIPPVSAAR